MKFVAEKKKGNVLNTFSMKIVIGHGDGDHYETLYLGPYPKEQLFVISGIEKAFEEMKESDKETNNHREYSSCLHFRRFLKKHWKHDLFAKKSGEYPYAFMREYKIFHIDEEGMEFEIESVECIEEPKTYYYIKVGKGSGYCLFYEGDILTTYEKFDSDTIKEWSLVELEDAEEFIKEYRYEEVEMDREDFDEEREFLVTHHFEKIPVETKEEEDKIYNKMQELKKMNSN